MKAFGINMNSSPAGKKRSAPSMLESPYSKTFIFTPHSKDMEVKEVKKLIFIIIIKQIMIFIMSERYTSTSFINTLKIIQHIIVHQRCQQVH